MNDEMTMRSPWPTALRTVVVAIVFRVLAHRAAAAYSGCRAKGRNPAVASSVSRGAEGWEVDIAERRRTHHVTSRGRQGGLPPEAGERTAADELTICCVRHLTHHELFRTFCSKCFTFTPPDRRRLKQRPSTVRR